MPLLEKPPFLNMSDATAVDDCAAAAMDDLSKEKSAALVAKHQHEQLIRDALPQCQPQEGSPANTFTIEELQVLQAAMGISSSSSLLAAAAPDAQQQQSQHPPFSLPNSNQRNEEDAATATNSLAEKHQTISTGSNSSRIGLNIITAAAAATAPLGQRLIDIREPWGVEEVDSPEKIETCFSPLPLAAASSHQPHWIPRAIPTATTTAMARLFREAVRTGRHTAPTNGVCPGFLQCNLVVLPLDTVAFDFLLFCQRNSQACPLLEVCVDDDDNNDDGEEPRLLEDEKDGQRKRNTRKQYSYAPQRLAQGADLRTDISKFAIYRNGVLQEEVADCTEYWPERGVAFLIGCSFSYDEALRSAGIRLRSAEAGRNVPMYKTNIACKPAGRLHGNVVVSMKPIHCTLVAKEVEITSRYKHAHGGPLCVGCPSAIGIAELNCPDWGDSIEVRPDEVPVFHACGVTPQAVLMASRVPFAITHAAGHMFVTDQPSDMGLL